LQQIYLTNSNVKRDFFNILEDNEKDITLDYFNQRNTFENMFESALAGDTDLIDIIIYKVKTQGLLHFTFASRKIDNSFNFYSYKWFAAAGENYGLMHIVPSYIPGYITNDKRPVYSVYAGFMDSHNNLAGVIRFNFDAQKLQRSYSEYKDSVKGSILVTNKDGEVFFDSTNEYYGKKYPYFKLLKNSNNYIQLKDESLVVLKETQTDLVAAGVVPKGEILQRINLVIRTIFLVMTLCIFISIILVYIISTRFSRRVKSVTNAMKEVEKGNLKKRIPQGKGNDDIEQINSNFNRMCERLESYIEKVYLAEIKSKDAQLTALQTQINPHFLYNTLEVIRMKAIMSNAEDVSEMIYILSNLFRDSLENSDMVIRVEDEVNYCKSYLELHRIRLCDRLKVVLELHNH
jgi:two-component system sensor histidine kinase YesM